MLWVDKMFMGILFFEFLSIFVEEVLKIVLKIVLKFCELDLMFMKILKFCIENVLLIIMCFVN